MHYTVAVVTKENDEDEVEKFQNKVKKDIEAFKNGTYNTKDYRVQGRTSRLFRNFC